MTSRVRKQSDGLPQKGPMKATLPMSSLLRGSIASGSQTIGSGVFSAVSPPMRLISPEHSICGHRSPGALNSKSLHLFLLHFVVFRNE